MTRTSEQENPSASGKFIVYLFALFDESLICIDMLFEQTFSVVRMKALLMPLCQNFVVRVKRLSMFTERSSCGEEQRCGFVLDRMRGK